MAIKLPNTKPIKISILITAWEEPTSVSRNIQTIINNSLDLEIVLVAPDIQTQHAARRVFSDNHYTKFQIITDPKTGKPNALNIGLANIDADWVICTDGDVVLFKESIPDLTNQINEISNDYGAISARPISVDSKKYFWGYIGNLLADSAHLKRTQSPNYFVSGYLCAYKKSKIHPLPSSTLVDDAQFSLQILSQDLKIKYLPIALVGVKYPNNTKDWLIQKRRSAGGYRELSDQIKSLNIQSTQRNFFNELQFISYPVKYSKNIIELFYSLVLYPLRLLLWILIYKDNIIKPTKPWQRVESTKFDQ